MGYYSATAGGRNLTLDPGTLGDLALQLPAASSQLIKKVLAQLKNEGKVRLSLNSEVDLL
jgi:hypothetical protein